MEEKNEIWRGSLGQNLRRDQHAWQELQLDHDLRRRYRDVRDLQVHVGRVGQGRPILVVGQAGTVTKQVEKDRPLVSAHLRAWQFDGQSAGRNPSACLGGVP